MKKSKSAKVTRQRILRAHARRIGIGSILALGIWAFLVAVVQPALQGSAGTCAISATLVNSCRPWLGAAANNYPQTASDSKSQLLYHEQRIGRPLDIVHTYHPVGSNKLSSTDTYFATRANTYLFTNWKPASKWADAAGGNATVNSSIDQMAASVKAVSPHTIFMTIHHEPENDVSGGAPACSTFKGSFGTTSDYRAMWRNVETRFKNAGATNVVWVMDYMNYSLWDCMVNDLYPGDDLVNWVMFNAYGRGGDTWTGNVSRFYTLLANNSNAQHNYAAKPWGIVEWSYNSGTSAQHVSYINQVKDALDKNTFPNLKAYMVYDSRDQGSSTGTNLRVAYDDAGNYVGAQMDAYAALANDPKITGNGGNTSSPPPAPAPGPSPSPTPSPTPTPTPPTSGSSAPPAAGSSDTGSTLSTTPSSPTSPIAVSGAFIVTPVNPGDSVQVSLDGSPLASSTVDTNTLTNGVHTVTVTESGRPPVTHYIEVNNPLPQAILNNLRTYAPWYTAGTLVVVGGLILIFRARLGAVLAMIHA
jgi:hypothetical protein